MRINEQNFIKYLQAGKEDALDYVIDHYLPLIKAIVLKTLGPLSKNDISKECCNDILFSIWKNAKKFSGNATDFKKWVCVIAKYKAIDFYRAELKKKEIASFVNLAEPIDLTTSNHSTLENKEYIQSILSKLKPLDQKIFIMRYLLDFDTEEIARQLQMTKSAIDNRLYHGRKKIKKDLGGIPIERSV